MPSIFPRHEYCQHFSQSFLSRRSEYCHLQNSYFCSQKFGQCSSPVVTYSVSQLVELLYRLLNVLITKEELQQTLDPRLPCDEDKYHPIQVCHKLFIKTFSTIDSFLFPSRLRHQPNFSFYSPSRIGTVMDESNSRLYRPRLAKMMRHRARFMFPANEFDRLPKSRFDQSIRHQSQGGKEFAQTI